LDAEVLAAAGINSGITSLTGLDDDGIPLAKVANAASDGANSDITSMTGLDDGGIPLAKVDGAAASGANADITSMTGLDDGGIPLAKVDGAAAETAWTDYSGTSTITGWSSFTTKKIYTKKIGKTIFMSVDLRGTSNAIGISFTLPYTSTNDVYRRAVAYGVDNGTGCIPMLQLPNNSDTVTSFKTVNNDPWTNSGNKYLMASFFYEIP
jgi:hypothetical protein